MHVQVQFVVTGPGRQQHRRDQFPVQRPEAHVGHVVQRVRVVWWRARRGGVGAEVVFRERVLRHAAVLVPGKRPAGAVVDNSRRRQHGAVGWQQLMRLFQRSAGGKRAVVLHRVHAVARLHNDTHAGPRPRRPGCWWLSGWRRRFKVRQHHDGVAAGGRGGVNVHRGTVHGHHHVGQRRRQRLQGVLPRHRGRLVDGQPRVHTHGGAVAASPRVHGDRKGGHVRADGHDRGETRPQRGQRHVRVTGCHRA